MISNYTESVITSSEMWNDIAFSNVGYFKNATKKPINNLHETGNKNVIV